MDGTTNQPIIEWGVFDDLVKKREVTIHVNYGDTSKTIEADEYTGIAQEGFSVFVPRDADLMEYIRIFHFVPKHHGVPVLLGRDIDQPLDGKNPIIPDPAQAVYSKIRGAVVDEYYYYTCAHAPGELGHGTLAEGDGIHHASSSSDIKDCRDALGILNQYW